MLSKNNIKHINSLKINKFRKKYSEFIVEGDKCVFELLKSDFNTINIFANAEWIENYSTMPEISETEIIEITDPEMKKISSFSTACQILAIAEIPQTDFEKGNISEKLTLMIDDIKDPGNLGTIIRTADWFGINHIICSNETVDLFNPKVIQSSMGSFTRVKLLYVELSEYLQNLQPDICVYSCVLDGENIYKTELSKNGIIILGSESHGVSEKLSPFISKKIAIPSFVDNKNSGNSTESLNVSVAAGIICSEFKRM